MVLIFVCLAGVRRGLGYGYTIFIKERGFCLYQVCGLYDWLDENMPCRHVTE